MELWLVVSGWALGMASATWWRDYRSDRIQRSGSPGYIGRVYPHIKEDDGHVRVLEREPVEFDIDDLFADDGEGGHGA